MSAKLFENFEVDQTKIPSLLSLPFSELAQIKHILRQQMTNFHERNKELPLHSDIRLYIRKSSMSTQYKNSQLKNG